MPATPAPPVRGGPREVAPPPALDRCRALVEPALREAVAELHPWPRHMASFAFGWCDADGRPGSAHGGKGVRQALAVLGAEAAGAPGETAVPGAVAVELVHTFSLVHDDIMDDDERRRHRDSAWKAFGTGPAVLAGDALFALAVRTLARAGGEHGGAAVALLAEALSELVHGQADDLLFESRPWTGPGAVGLTAYRDMALRKTGSLLGCAAALGPVLAGASPAVVTALAEAGRRLGSAFQAVDDLLGIWGDPTATGKPVHGDLRRGKKTLPLLAAVTSGTAAGRELAGLLGSGAPLDAGTARHAALLTEEAGGREYTLAEARRHVAAAHTSLHAVRLAPHAASELVTLAEYLVERHL
ncbi:polyprenyl synthetase family protein [Streptomyces sp. NPDC049577]|uniref:polyprenyl synthetase family protein n=1 Tax=Streptomyces sp. NPDC049577 TaxID=3155153 RepID=UPI003422BBAA